MTTAQENHCCTTLQDWLDRHEITQAAIGEQVGISQQRAGAILKRDTIYREYWEKLRSLGVPAELLPAPVEKQLGRPPKKPNWPALEQSPQSHG